MPQVKEGDKIKVHYTGKFKDGTVFDSSRERQPLEFTIGAGQLIKGFDQGVRGMEIGQQKTLEISPDDAYGKKSKSPQGAKFAFNRCSNLITSKVIAKIYNETATFPATSIGTAADKRSVNA